MHSPAERADASPMLRHRAATYGLGWKRGKCREVTQRMAWETRERGGRYYTRSRKVGGRVVREYVGRGPLAEAMAALDAIDREEREEAAARRRAEQERDATALDGLALLNDGAEAVARAALVAAGYRQHKRGEWRRRRSDGANDQGKGPAALPGGGGHGGGDAAG